jgi:hypothetical protein
MRGVALNAVLCKLVTGQDEQDRKTADFSSRPHFVQAGIGDSQIDKMDYLFKKSVESMVLGSMFTEVEVSVDLVHLVQSEKSTPLTPLIAGLGFLATLKNCECEDQ